MIKTELSNLLPILHTLTFTVIFLLFRMLDEFHFHLKRYQSESTSLTQTAYFSYFFNHIWRRKLCWGIIFTWVTIFFYSLLFIYFIKHTRYFSCLKIDQASLIILKFIFKTCKSYYFLKCKQ